MNLIKQKDPNATNTVIMRRRYASVVHAITTLSVCLFVCYTLVISVKTVKHIIKPFHHTVDPSF